MIIRPEFIYGQILGINDAVLFERVTNIDRRTYKSWQKKKSKPRESTIKEVCRQFNQKIKTEFGIDPNWNPETARQLLPPASAWTRVFDNPLNRNTLRGIPNTKKLVLSFEKEGNRLTSFLDGLEFEKAAGCYSDLSFDGLFFESDIIKKGMKAKSINDFAKTTLIFTIRVLLYCLASLDAEIFGKENPSHGETSRFNHLLPKMRDNTIVSPIGLWFGNLKTETGQDSWDKMIENTNLAVDLEQIDGRQFRRWANGKIPKTSTVAKIVMSLFPEDNLYWHLQYYGWAKVLNFIYQCLNESINTYHLYQGSDEDILEFFQDYNYYYSLFIGKYTAPMSN